MKTLLQAAKTAPSAEYFKGYRDGLRLSLREDAAPGPKESPAQLAAMIVDALEEGYTSGVEALVSYARDGDTIYGRFRDGSKTFGYTLSDGQIGYWLLKGPQRADSLGSSPIWRADKILAKKKKSENVGKGSNVGEATLAQKKIADLSLAPKQRKISLRL